MCRGGWSLTHTYEGPIYIFFLYQEHVYYASCNTLLYICFTLYKLYATFLIVNLGQEGQGSNQRANKCCFTHYHLRIPLGLTEARSVLLSMFPQALIPGTDTSYELKINPLVFHTYTDCYILLINYI